jgi:hypothetical protein
MTPKEVLIAAKALIDTEGKWTKGHYHEDGRHCAMGALYAVGLEHKVLIKPAASVLEEAIPTRYWQTPEGYNDSRKRTHADVMAWFDRAIEAAGAS